eukprot:15338603-Ditylum_brightwellii.AAC.2
MPKGAIYAIYIKHKAADYNKVISLGTDKCKPVKVNVAHALLGHVNDTDSKKSAKHLGYEIS